MNRILIATALISATFITSAFAADVGVSVSIGQPGFYGRLDIGGYPPPRVIYRQPRIVERIYEEREPIYLHVPLGHIKHWNRYCREYNACGELVYFVQDDWYVREYAPRYQYDHRESHGEFRDNHREEHRESHQDGKWDDHQNGHKESRRNDHEDNHHEDHNGRDHGDDHEH